MTAFIYIGSEIGGLLTLLGVFVTAIFGVVLLKRQGLSVLGRIQADLAKGLRTSPEASFYISKFLNNSSGNKTKIYHLKTYSILKKIHVEEIEKSWKIQTKIVKKGNWQKYIFITMETVEIDANVKIEVPWEDDVLSNEIVANDFDDFKVKSEPVDNSVDDGENQDHKHEIIDIKDEFGHAMKDFDLSKVNLSSDCSENGALATENLTKEEEKSPNSIICSISYENFENTKSWKLHKKMIHQKKKKYLCSFCPAKFSQKCQLKSHIKNSRLKGHEVKFKHQCPFYPAMSEQKLGVKMHIETVHEKKKEHQCSLSSWGRPKGHEGNKPFKCEDCDYRSVKCDICNAIIITKNGLKRHINSVHEGIKPFKCNICDYQTAHKLSLKNHIAAVHEENTSFKDAKTKPFVCTICDAIFSRKTNMAIFMDKKSLSIHIAAVHEKSTALYRKKIFHQITKL